MVTCANCTNEAIYTYPISETFLIHYCQYHLPKFLTNQKRAGQLPLRVETVISEPEVVEEVVAKPSKKKAAPVEVAVEEAPVVEEVPTEEAPVGE